MLLRGVLLCGAVGAGVFGAGVAPVLGGEGETAGDGMEGASAGAALRLDRAAAGSWVVSDAGADGGGAIGVSGVASDGDDAAGGVTVERERGWPGWTLRAETRAWFPALRGDIALGGADMFDLSAVGLDEVRASPMLALTLRREAWTVHADGFWFGSDERVGADRAFDLGGMEVAVGDVVDAEVDYAAASLALGRRVYALDLDYAGRPAEPTPFNVPGEGTYVWIDVYAGARLYALDLDVEAVGGGAGVDVSEVWVDPVVGARLTMDLPEGFAVMLQSDIGGFGFGSEFSWDLQTSFDYALTSYATAQVGFRILSVDRELEDEDGVWDASLAGLFGGVTFRY